MARFNRVISSSGAQRSIVLTVPFVVFLIAFNSNILNGSCYRVVRQVPGAAAVEQDPMMNETSASPTVNTTGKDFNEIVRDVFVTNETFDANIVEPNVMQPDIESHIYSLIDEVFMTNASSNSSDPVNSTMSSVPNNISEIASSTMAATMAAPATTVPTLVTSMSTSNETILVSTMQPDPSTTTTKSAKGAASNLALNVGFLLLSFVLLSV